MVTHLSGTNPLASSKRQLTHPCSVMLKKCSENAQCTEPNSAKAEYSYSGVLYRDALATLERKLGQPHAVVGAYLAKLSKFPPLKVHNLESVFVFLQTFSDSSLFLSICLSKMTSKLSTSLTKRSTSFPQISERRGQCTQLAITDKDQFYWISMSGSKKRMRE